jgi:hypothetical protein
MWNGIFAFHDESRIWNKSAGLYECILVNLMQRMWQRKYVIDPQLTYFEGPIKLILPSMNCI